MANPITFEAFMGWVDITDPNNIPQDARTITAADLLRYENFCKDAAVAINGQAAEFAPATGSTNYAPATGSTNYAAKSVEASLAGHIDDAANPHAVTKAQVGLSLVDNTTDAGKPVSIAQQAALDKLAKGCLYATTVNTTSGNLSTLAVVNNIASFAFKAGRKYRIVWDTDWLGNAANTSGMFQIATAATTDAAGATTGLTVRGTRNSQAPIAGVSSSVLATGYFDPTADATLQIKFLAAIDGSGTTLAVQGNRTGAPGQYRIYDDGAQF